MRSQKEVLQLQSRYNLLKKESPVTDWRQRVGKFFENIFGNNRDFHVGISPKRRAGGSFYYYNYVFYREMGANVHCDKKNWIGWCTTNADELRIGWQNVRVKVKLPIIASPLYHTDFVYVSPSRIVNIPEPTGCIDILGLTEIKQKDFYSELGKGAKFAWSWLNTNLGVQDHSNAVKMFAIYAAESVVICYPPEFVVKYNEDSYTHVFNKSFLFVVSLNMASLPSSLKDYAMLAKQTIQNTQKLDNATLISGEVVSGARCGDTWGGMGSPAKVEDYA